MGARGGKKRKWWVRWGAQRQQEAAKKVDEQREVAYSLRHSWVVGTN